jgi:hypothetical protein
MNFYLYSVLALCIFIPAIIALIRIKKIDSAFYPFVFFLFAGSLNELLSMLLILNKHQTIVNSNIYVLIEAVLLLCFFKKLGVFDGRKYSFNLLLSFIVLLWLSENFFIGKLTINSTYFRISYSLLLVFLSINVLNSMIFSTRKQLSRDALFLILVSFIIYFSCKALIQAFVIYGINRSSSFLLNIYIIMIYVNFIINLIYALAVLWIPRKNRFIKPLLLA